MTRTSSLSNRRAGVAMLALLAPAIVACARGDRDGAPVVASAQAAPATPPAAPTPPAPAPAPAPAPTPVDDEPTDERVIPAGTCRLPEGYEAPAMKGDPAELRRAIQDWLAADTSRRAVPIAARRGVLYVQSEEDRGDDPPYPRLADPEAFRACGSSATWLRSHLRERLQYAELACDGTVCCYPGMEYAPNGYVVFRPVVDHGEASWALDAWIEVHELALGPDYVAANRRFVTAALRRLAGTRCPGEPDVTE